MNISFNLYQLQKIDSQITEGNKRLIALEKELEGNPELRKARLDVSEALNRLDHSIQEFDEVNYRVETKKIKIGQSESSLYNGTEKNPKVLQDLQKEISFLKNNLLELNDELLEKMISRENFETEYKKPKKYSKSKKLSIIRLKQY